MSALARGTRERLAGTAVGLDGLTDDEARAQLTSAGPNELPVTKGEGLGRRFLRQVAEPLTILLIAAALVAWLGLGEQLDGTAILAIVLANIGIALLQEGKTANALKALRSMETPTARVRRAGTTRQIAAREVVPGDIVLLAAGERVPADLRLLDAAGLEIDESMLTGESLPAHKDGTGPGDDGLGDQRGRAFAGTLVFRGSATGLVIATGARTQLGTIASQLGARQPPTPLQRELRTVSARLGAIAIAIAVVVFGVMLVRFGVGRVGLEMAFLTSAALAVAAVPEGLPTVVTVGLALGVRRMAARGSIVRRLPAVETLGSTDVILTDKTGTLTENTLRVDGVACVDGPLVPFAALPEGVRQRSSLVMSLCSDATLRPPTGDPLEIALLDAVGDTRVRELRDAYPRLDARPFDAQTRSMSTINGSDKGAHLLMKGAPEIVAEHCTRFLDASASIRSLDRESVRRIVEMTEDLAGRGARVIALAERTLASPLASIGEEERDLTFVGVVALRDPVRPEAAAAVADAIAAGVRILMVTGDHPGTASAVAEEVGLATSSSPIVHGLEIERRGFPADPTTVPIYARVSPDHKLELTRSLQKQGHVVAVTGDGVNDAPALRRADIGVAMGRVGSDVAREAADMVVTDDNLATIVHAVREGRGIYDNIRKVVEYLVAGNLSEILVVVGGLIFFPHLGVPLLPLQLLWLNLLTDGFPALALGVDPLAPDLMDRPPRPRTDHLLSSGRLRRLGFRALLISTSALASLAFARFVWHQPWGHARASMFSVLMTAHLLYAFAVRRSEGKAGGRNGWLFAAVAGGIALQVAIVSIPQMQTIFSTASLSMKEWVLVAIAGTVPVLTIGALSKARRARAT